MSTLDKINSELSLLQEELSKLKHYTDEIGTAKNASSAVVIASKEFLSSFQQQVEEINRQMIKSASDFTKSCNETSTSFDTANASFQKGINDAKSSLKQVGDELSVVASKVNSLASKIESIDILGHFEKTHSTLNEISSLQKKNHSETNIIIQSVADNQNSFFISAKKKFLYTMIFQSVSLIILLMIFLRLSKVI